MELLIVMKLKELFETASGTSAGDVATVFKPGAGSAVGTLFGGSYGAKQGKKNKAAKPRESILRR